tara:strand:+ start:303 stop:569 length:267 start_codon:yes stop_codon:yes gene_type:complete
MEGKETLAIKRTLYNVGTQHNKLTTMVMVCLQEIEKLKKEIKELKSGQSYNHQSASEQAAELNNNVPNESQELEDQAKNILKQLNINN